MRRLQPNNGALTFILLNAKAYESQPSWIPPHAVSFVALGRPQCDDFASQAFTPEWSPTARYRCRSFGQSSSTVTGT